jgi:hypothetical protein
MPDRDAREYRRKAQKCRQLARFSEEREAKILNDMAAEYEAAARQSEN